MRREPKFKPRSFIMQAWDLWSERAATRKALRRLIKQEWSLEFLTAMLVRAANCMGQPLQLDIINKDGMKLKITTVEAVTDMYRDDSIFNHLDDEMKVQQFINEVGRK